MDNGIHPGYAALKPGQHGKIMAAPFGLLEYLPCFLWSPAYHTGAGKVTLVWPEVRFSTTR
jgi:hypothetical protein